MPENSIFVKVFGKRRCFLVNQITTLPDLFKKILAEYSFLDSKQCYLTCGGQTFNENTKGTIIKNIISKNVTLELVIRVLGGSNSSDLHLDFGDVTFTKKPCSIYCTDDLLTDRVMIKCSCAFSFEAINDFIENFKKNFDVDLKCPLCQTDWNYLSIRYVLAYNKTPLELEKLDNDISEKRINFNNDLKRCPHCDTLCERPDANMLRVVCQLCQSSDFCWECGVKWQGNSKRCLSPICNNKNSRIQILNNCQLKKIGAKKNVPAIRACPKCNSLIEHINKCKHICCKFCKCEFCHVCLSLKIDGNWPCGSANSKCLTAARQI